MNRRYKYAALAHQAGCIRKRYRLTPLEAAWCTLWLAGAEESEIPALVQQMDKLRTDRREAADERRTGDF